MSTSHSGKFARGRNWMVWTIIDMCSRKQCAVQGSALITFGCGCRVPAGTVDTVLSYCHYSLNDQTLADMIPYLKEKNVGIINASALSMGLLTDQASPGLAVHHKHYLGHLKHSSRMCHCKGYLHCQPCDAHQMRSITAHQERLELLLH